MSQRRRGRWLLWAVGLAVVALPPLYLFLWAGGTDLRRARAELDAADPGWRLDDLLAAQQAALPPADQNALVLADEVPPWGLLPAAYQEWAKAHTDHRSWLPERDLNRLPGLDSAAAVDAWRAARPALDLARRIRHTPAGGVVVAVPDNAFDTRFVHLDTAGQVIQLLSFDAAVSAVRNDQDRALESIRATLNLARAVDGPFLLTAHFRLSFNGRAVRDLERVMALTEPRAGLPELQAALLAEADAGAVAAGLRGGRAAADREFASIEDGQIGLRPVLAGVGGGIGPQAVVEAVRYRPYLRVDHARTLRLFTALIEVARQPPGEWTAGANAVPAPPADGKHVLSRWYHTQATKLLQTGLHDQANLRTAAIAVACERFRQAHGRWPDTLTELVPAYLTAVPTDPYDGQPLRLRRTADGLMVYAVGPDGVAPRKEIGFRLWDVDRRRAAPAPDAP
ncbi:MAG: hypothetical protein U0871_14295 [Gemmataceae bacterium]